MLKTLNFLTIVDRIKRNVLILIFKMKTGDVAPELCDKVQYVGDLSGRVTRQSNHLVCRLNEPTVLKKH